MRLIRNFENASDGSNVRFFFVSIPTSLAVTIHELKKEGLNWTIVSETVPPEGDRRDKV